MAALWFCLLSAIGGINRTISCCSAKVTLRREDNACCFDTLLGCEEIEVCELPFCEDWLGVLPRDQDLDPANRLTSG
jgi:hypothetical protein